MTIYAPASPADHRAIVDAWREHAPANDCDIIPPRRVSSSPRHAHLADELSCLLTWRSLACPAEVLSTNWLAAPVNDNAMDERQDPYEDGPSSASALPMIESEHEIRPRPPEMMRATRGVEIAYSEAPLEFCSPAIAVGGDMEVHPEFEPAVIGGTAVAPIARIGSLRFANGETLARTTVRGENGISNENVRAPAGALLYYQATAEKRGRPVIDRFSGWLGSEEPEEDRSARVDWLVDTLSAATPRFIPRSRQRRRDLRGLPNPPLPPTSMPLDAARAFCRLPPARKTEDRPALPCASPDPWESFIGLRCTSTGSAPASGGGAALARLEARGTAALLRKRLSADDVLVLDTALEARNFTELGKVFGRNGKNAERRGQAALLAASKNLSAILDEIAA